MRHTIFSMDFMFCGVILITVYALSNAQFSPTQPGQIPPTQPGQIQPAQPGQIPPTQPGQFPSAQPGQFPSAQPGQFPSGQLGQFPSAQPGQFPSAQPGQIPPTQPSQFPPVQPGQMNPTQQQTSCSARFEASVTPTCFDATGVNFTGIIYLLSGNRSGAIPNGYTYQSFVQFICSTDMQDKLIPCVQGEMVKYNTSECAPADRALLFNRGGQLMTFLEAICGQPCEQESTNSLMQCYAAININPEAIVGRNASIIEDKLSIIGRNESEFDNFCTNRQKLFSCLGPLSSTCPGLLQRLYTIGIDLQALEVVSGTLCSDKPSYVKGLTCAMTPSPDLAQCAQTTISKMQAVAQGRFQTGTVPPSKYMPSLCETKLAQMGCEHPAYGKVCDADQVALRINTDCGLLPKPCRESQQFQSVYAGLCQKASTSSPVQTVRPTQGQPGPVLVAGGSSPTTDSPRFGGSTSAAGCSCLSIVTLMLSLAIKLSFF